MKTWLIAYKFVFKNSGEHLIYTHYLKSETFPAKKTITEACEGDKEFDVVGAFQILSITELPEGWGEE